MTFRYPITVCFVALLQLMMIRFSYGLWFGNMTLPGGLVLSWQNYTLPIQKTLSSNPGCPVPVVADGGTYSAGSNTPNPVPVGQTLTLSCNNGLQAACAAVIKCTSSGGYSPEPNPSCCNINCASSSLPKVANGNVRGIGDTTYGSARGIVCNNGYTLVGDRFILCESNGLWSRPTGACLRKDPTTRRPPVRQLASRDEILPMSTLRKQQLLCELAGKGDVDHAKRYLANSDVDVNWRGCETGPQCLQITRGTALHRAVSCNQSADMAALLVKNGASVTALEGKYSWTPLHYAASLGNVQVSKILVDNGCDVDAPDKTGRTPLTEAAWNGQLKEVGFLLDHGANIESNKGNGESALTLATMRNKTDVVMDLLDSGANLNYANQAGWTAMMEAAKTGNTQIVTTLIDRGADMDVRAKSGKYAKFTAIMIGAAFNNEGVVTVLSNSGASPVGCVNNNRIFNNLCPEF